MEAMTTDDQGDRGELVYGLVIGLAYVVLVGLQVYLIADERAGGDLTRTLAARWERLTANWRHRRAMEREYQAQRPWVLYDAQVIAAGEEP